MPRNGSGVYSKPAGSDAVSNTTIESSKFNALMNDIVADMNAARPIPYGGTGGDSVISGWDGLAKAGSDVASAATLDLDSATGPFVDITGTTSVTAVTLTSGRQRRARATGAFLLTASSSLIVNGSTTRNFRCTAGDLLFFEGYGAGVVRVWAFSTAVRGWEAISATAFSNQASVAFTDLGDYRMLRMSGWVLPKASGGQSINLRASTDNGSTWISGSTDYTAANVYGSGTTPGANALTTASAWQIGTAGNFALAWSATFTALITEFNQSGSVSKIIVTEAHLNSSATPIEQITQGYLSTNTSVRNALQLTAASGNIDGHIVLEGVR